MEKYFGMRKTHISACCPIECMVNCLYDLAVPYFANPIIWLDQMPFYVQKVVEKRVVLDHTWGFINGTFRKTSRPMYIQRLVYSRHKRHHGDTVSVHGDSDGYIASLLLGHVNGGQYDSFLLHKRGLINRL